MSAVLPELFVDPLWEQQARAAVAAAAAERAKGIPLVPGLKPPTERSVVWEPGEREGWLRRADRLRPASALSGAEDWGQVVRAYRDGAITRPSYQANMFGAAPVELVAPLLPEWQPRLTGIGAGHDLRVLAARFECDALHVVVSNAKSNAYDNGPALVPFLEVEVARLMADWLVRLKSAQRIARGWFARHGLTAVPYLVPDALAKRRVPREKAAAALALIAEAHGVAEVVAAARVFGEEAAAGIARLLSAETPEVVQAGPVDKPAKPPKLPWLNRDELPEVRLHDGSPLSATARDNLIGGLALSPGYRWNGPAQAYPGLREAVERCDSRTLADFGWALFEQWLHARMPGRNAWVVDQFCWLADDAAVERLGALLLRWPGAGSDKHAIGVLGAIGTDTALLHLHRISQRAKAPGQRTTAEGCLHLAATARGLTADELADRLVPDLGLDADGTLLLDYGSRRFTVGFDEQLAPFVIDESGTRRKTLPKPGVKDDGELAPAAYERFGVLKKSARGVVGDQIRRLERAMITQRRWSTAEFDRYLVTHPLLRHLARRLVWTTGGTNFRLAEDFTPTDIEDAPVRLPESARIGIAHPLELGDAVARWGEVFADYEITQPFRQLGRPVYALTPEERATRRIRRFDGAEVSVGALLGLTRRGWDRAAAQDGGVQPGLYRALGAGLKLVVELDPGIVVGAVDIHPVQKITEICFTAGDLDTVTEVTASEVLADLAGLT
ncbi:DUF4132 domain-containing protein [Nocardia otitidiscaviarum]|uniref:DUF4132 domain-containing protein n=1 Tax=Nocardia otitidiscaviarum TaxID=1823 RepID=UPI001893E09A|nr:DUF4132 domain-containing protein [Nocardia otitidiscaviarum]MBF6133254.1 DUF4132 domain-containing protein [Nocardia otitidiscaviarum]